MAAAPALPASATTVRPAKARHVGVLCRVARQNDDDLLVLEVGGREVHVGFALFFVYGEAVPDAVDLLAGELQFLGVPVDDHEFRRKAQFGAGRFGELRVETNELAARVVVIHGFVLGDTDYELAVGLNIAPVVVRGGRFGRIRRSGFGRLRGRRFGRIGCGGRGRGGAGDAENEHQSGQNQGEISFFIGNGLFLLLERTLAESKAVCSNLFRFRSTFSTISL